MDEKQVFLLREVKDEGCRIVVAEGNEDVVPTRSTFLLIRDSDQAGPHKNSAITTSLYLVDDKMVPCVC